MNRQLAGHLFLPILLLAYLVPGCGGALYDQSKIYLKFYTVD